MYEAEELSLMVVNEMKDKTSQDNTADSIGKTYRNKG
jgi:hypothetical protein